MVFIKRKTNDDVHKLIKASKTRDEFIIKTIEEFVTLHTLKKQTDLLQNRTVCYLTTGVLGFGGGNHLNLIYPSL